MKLGIFCNFGPPHCGGSEIVLENIATRLIAQYGYDITIYGYNYSNKFKYKGINVIPCRKGSGLIAQINRNDHVFTYSDSFWGMGDIIRYADKIAPQVSLALVGAYYLQSHPNTLNLLKKNINKFNLITHSNLTPDYTWCADNDISVEVISNGVNLEEFSNCSIDFREKYKIKSKHIILSISNWFFGKGQEILPKIAKKIKSKDLIIIQLSNTVQYPYDLRFLQQTKQQSKGLNIRFLRDLPREDVISAFKCSDVFLFPSLKEVCPLVILESRAAKLPWISMAVGNVKEQSGGIVINNNNVDHKGYKIVDDKIINSYVVNIADVLKLKDMRENLITKGQKGVEKLDWKNIVPLYDEVFRR